MADHKLSTELHGQLERMLEEDSLTPLPVRNFGRLSPDTVEEAMKMNREGKVSGEKLVFEGLSED